MPRKKSDVRLQQISVSELKTHLLDVMRRVAAGESYEVTRSNKPIAVITPLHNEHLPVSGFARVTVRADVDIGPTDDWTFDAENVK